MTEVRLADFYHGPPGQRLERTGSLRHPTWSCSMFRAMERATLVDGLLSAFVKSTLPQYPKTR